MKSAREHLIRISAAVCSLMCCAVVVVIMGHTAFAESDACMTLDKNQHWTDEFNSLMANYKTQQYDEALKHADKLNKICSRSPALNFSIAQIYHAMGDDAKGLFYIQRATNSTEQFAVKGDLLERMWYTRYEMEHPDAAPESIKKLRNDNERLRSEAEVLREQEAQRKITEAEEFMTRKSHYAIGMWTGVASAGLGIVLTGVGAGLFAANRDDAISFNNDNAKVSVKPANYAYMGLMGAGIGLTVIGAAFAGIIGYHYLKLQNDSDLSMNISPAGMLVDIHF
ncbi:MAG: hypothetical protein J6A01_10820 [Proteobacteria bacterium]|nr:hypothetical protein [Pseudomonadota bacterium]